MNFNEVRKYLSKIPNIHAGGCGVSALAMYRWLKKNNQLRCTKIVYLYKHKEDFEDNTTRGTEYLDAPNHCCLLHEGKFIDAKGEVVTSFWGQYIQIIDNDKAVEKSIIKSEDWNYCFQRELYAPKIEKKLEIELDVI